MATEDSRKKSGFVLIASIVVAALGYFVDVYDVILFSVVRSKSLVGLGVTGDDLLPVGLSLLNWMISGMVLGGIIWGILGDKKGRLKVLFTSIILYSFANIANGYITTVQQYKILRFISGIGLAGELGAGITLVSEIMNPKKRGYGTMFIATIGMLGAVLAAYIGQYYEWRTAFICGGIMGLVLLVLRFGVIESSAFRKSQQQTNIQHGNILKLFLSRKLFSRYSRAFFVALPVYYVIVLLITLTPEFGKAFNMVEMPTAGNAVVVMYIAISFAGIICSLLSQILKSRKIPLYIFLTIVLTGIIFLLLVPPQTLNEFYIRYAVIGVGLGFWAVYMTSVAEQFGTNLRVTVTATAPNFSRALLIPLMYLFQLLNTSLGIINSAAIVGISSVIIAYLGLYFTDETFGRDLEFYE